MYGYVKVGSAVPKLRVADCVYNKEEILKLVEAAAAKQVRVLSFPELSVTGYTCADLFFQTPLLHAAEQADNASELTTEIEYMNKRIPGLIKMAWKHGCIQFWPDFDVLYRYFPLRTRAYRLWLEVRARLKKKNA